MESFVPPSSGIDNDMLDALMDGHQRLLNATTERVTRVETSVNQLVAQQAIQGTKLDQLVSKISDFVDELMTHNRANEKLRFQVHDLESDSTRRKQSGKTVTWVGGTIAAAVLGDLILHIISHFHFV